MAQVWPWPQSGHEKTSVVTAESRNKKGSLYLMDDGGIWRYGLSKATLVAGDLVKRNTADWEFTGTVAGDEGKGVIQLHVAGAASSSGQYGWFAWKHPSISIVFDAAAIAIGELVTLGAGAKKAKAWASLDVPIGHNNAAVPTAGTATAITLYGH